MEGRKNRSTGTFRNRYREYRKRQGRPCCVRVGILLILRVFLRTCLCGNRYDLD